MVLFSSEITSILMCKSETWKPMTQHSLLIHYCTQKITLFLLQLDVINTTVRSAKTVLSSDWLYKHLLV